MLTGFIRTTIGLSIAALALAAFLAALLVEWIGDLTRRCPHPENHQ